MAFDAHKNFAISTVSTAPSPATTGTSLVVASGTGALFPAVPFNAVIWPTAANPTVGNAEIVRVTAIATDTFTITRTQEGTSARTVVVGDQIMAAATAKTFTDIEAATGAVGAPGAEIGYDQITANVSVSSETESAGTTVITAAAHTFDGAPVMVEFFAPSCVLTGAANGVNLAVSLFEGSTEIGKLCMAQDQLSTGTGSAESLPLIGRFRFTPSAGSHTYKVTAFTNWGTSHSVSQTINAGAGGTAAYVPAYLRFTKV